MLGHIFDGSSGHHRAVIRWRVTWTRQTRDKKDNLVSLFIQFHEVSRVMFACLLVTNVNVHRYLEVEAGGSRLAWAT